MVLQEPADSIEKTALTIIAAVRHKFEKSTTSVAIFGEFNCHAQEVCQKIAALLHEEDFSAITINQDDYFRLTPTANLTKRIEDPTWLGPHEARLDLMDSHIHKIVKGKGPIEKPVIIPGDERFETEQVPNFHYDLVLAYGCYTGLLEHIDYKVFLKSTTPAAIPGGNPIFQQLYQAEKSWVEKQIPLASTTICID